MKIHFSSHLHRFIDLPNSVTTELKSLPKIIDEIDQSFSGFTGYVVHENGSLRQHVNVFLDDRIVVDREKLSDDLDGVKEIYFMQALSGG